MRILVGSSLIGIGVTIQILDEDLANNFLSFDFTTRSST